MFDRLVVLIPALPFLAAVCLAVPLFAGRSLSEPFVRRLACAVLALSFLGSLGVLIQCMIRPEAREVMLGRFLESGAYQIRLVFWIDPLSSMMMPLVTGFTLLVAWFGKSYMHRESGFGRFYAVLCLFAAEMLLLVMGGSFVLMFAGWEGVGLCSYLLIGFYYDRNAPANAATRAVVMNRFGDAGFLIAIFLIFSHVGSVEYSAVFAGASALDENTATAISLCLLLAAAAKSGQLPFSPWLARAMEGPTPTSALFYGAVMVNAGVYMMVRAHPIFHLAPNAMLAVGIVGGATALYAAMVSLVQTDVKGRLIFSTKAQLGLMFLACGLGAYAMAIVHMIAHSIIRCHDFLTAPSAIQVMRGRKAHRSITPASRTRVPLLARLLLFGALGLLLGPMMSEGWHSLERSPARGPNVVYALIVLAAFFTFHYMLRLVRRTLAAMPRSPEAPPDAAAPLPTRRLFPWVPFGVVGATGALLFSLPVWLDLHRIYASLAGALSIAPSRVQSAPFLSIVALALLIAIILAGWLIALYFQNDQPDSPGSALFGLRKLYVAALHRFWLDEMYARAIAEPVRRLGLALERIDSDGIDRAAGVLRRKIGQRSRLQAWQSDILAAEAQSADPGAEAPPPSATPIPSARGVAGRLMTWSSVFMHQVERQVITGGIGHGIPMAGSLLGRTLNHVETFLGKPRVMGVLVLFCLTFIIIYSVIHLS